MACPFTCSILLNPRLRGPIGPRRNPVSTNSVIQSGSARFRGAVRNVSFTYQIGYVLAMVTPPNLLEYSIHDNGARRPSQSPLPRDTGWHRLRPRGGIFRFKKRTGSLATLAAAGLERYSAALSSLDAGSILANREHGHHGHIPRRALRRIVQNADRRFLALFVRRFAGVESRVQLSDRGRRTFHWRRILHQTNQIALLRLCFSIELEQADYFCPQSRNLFWYPAVF